MRSAHAQLLALPPRPTPPAFRHRTWKSPVLRATIGFSLMVLGSVVTVAASAVVPVQAGALVLACLGAVFGLLTLIRSAAVRRIAITNVRNLQLEEALATSRAAVRQLDEALDSLRDVRRDEIDADEFISTVLTSTGVRLSPMHGEQGVRLYLVRCTPTHYYVTHRAGERGLPPGKACPADRPLDDVLGELAPHNCSMSLRLAPNVSGRLVLLAWDEILEDEKKLIGQLAIIIEAAALPLQPPLRAVEGATSEGPFPRFAKRTAHSWR